MFQMWKRITINVYKMLGEMYRLRINTNRGTCGCLSGSGDSYGGESERVRGKKYKTKNSLPLLPTGFVSTGRGKKKKLVGFWLYVYHTYEQSSLCHYTIHTRSIFYYYIIYFISEKPWTPPHTNVKIPSSLLFNSHLYTSNIHAHGARGHSFSKVSSGDSQSKYSNFLANALTLRGRYAYYQIG